MLRHIVKNSKQLEAFLLALHLNLYEPQRRHILNLMDALLVCQGKKTLSALHRQLVTPPSDVYALCDCLRESPWQGHQVRQQAKPYLVKQLFAQAEARGEAHILYISLDDSLTEKDQATDHLEAVDWHLDHTESSTKMKHFKKGLVHVHLRLQIGSAEITVDWRLYLRERTVRRLNRKREQGKKLAFKTKYRLVREMLLDLAPLLQADYKVYVLFDSWYASAKLIKLCKRLGFEVLCAIKSNRKLNGVQIRDLARTLRQQPYERVILKADSKKPITYLVRSLNGRLENVPFDVCVLISKRHYGDKNPAYFLSTDTNLTVQEVLERYEHRWACEVDNLYLKTQLGLGDFRVRCVEATQKWYALVFLALAYLQLRLMEENSDQIQTLADVIRLHRTEQAHTVFRAACRMAKTRKMKTVMKRFFYSQAA
jgi:hypothetical protein